MDDPVVPYLPHSSNSSTNISSSQSGSSLAERYVNTSHHCYLYVMFCIASGLVLHHRYHRNRLLLYIVSIVAAVSNKLTDGNSGMEFRLDVPAQLLRLLGVIVKDHTIISLVQTAFQA